MMALAAQLTPPASASTSQAGGVAGAPGFQNGQQAQQRQADGQPLAAAHALAQP